MRIVPAASVAAFFLVFTIPVLATTQTGPFAVTVTTSPNPYAIEGTTSVNKSAGILATSSGTGDSALEGYAKGPDSAGLEGFAQSTSGTESNGVYGYAANGYGVYGQAASSSDAGVFGLNLSTGGGIGVIGKSVAMGVYGEGYQGVVGVASGPGETGGSGMYGVYGDDQSTNQNENGVLGVSENGTGVEGESNGGGVGTYGYSAKGYGAYGESYSSDGTYGETFDAVNTGALFPNTLGASAGVFGQDETGSSKVAGNAGVLGTSQYGLGLLGNSTNGYGVYALSNAGTAIFANSTTGTAFNGSSGYEGIEGSTLDTAGDGHLAGIVGNDATSTSSLNTDIGVEGFSQYGQGMYGSSVDHQGVYGSSTTDTGVAAISTLGSGLIAEASGSSPAVGIYAYNGGDVIDAVALPSGASSTTSVMSVDRNGNMILAGAVTQFGTPKSAVRDASGAARVAYSQRATQSTIEDFGRAQMTGGRAVVRLDPAFASTLADSDYLVFLTARGDSNALYVANSSLAGFEIREHGGASTLAIDYRIVGRPRAEQPEPRLALMAPHRDSPATQQLARAADDIAQIAASHRAADAKLRAHLALLAHSVHAPRFPMPKRFKAPPKPPALPHIRIVRPDQYGPRLSR